ncbi:class I SAM-dependent methyltransferase [Neisseria sp. Ec49-e6-T10]|uniref:class I SAM-dependent methyltransferase n=1 Tax=Neisseria sp. Ec49-e6-T10 TaxID=3140744 RepID=UPI003EBDC218
MSQFAPPSSEAKAASDALIKTIQHCIEQNDGWISFAQYMNMALYTPQYGYYTGGSYKIGAQGDFITAPTLSTLFSHTLSKQVAQILPHTQGNIYEFGAGTGALALGIMQKLTQANIDFDCYYIIEVSAQLAQRQKALVSQHAPELLHKLVHLSALPEEFNGVIIGNEVLDAMPCEQIIWNKDCIKQQGVTYNQQEGFELDARPISDPNILKAAQVLSINHFPYQSELHLAQQAFIGTLAQKLTKGMMLFIDYGFDEQQYYIPERNMGTLIGHYQHHTIHDPFFLPGLCDLTCHINFTAMAQEAIDQKLDLLGYTTQAHFLLNLGITELLNQVGEPQSQAYIKEASACQTLLAQHEMGELFKVIAFGKNIDEELLGFTHGDLCHKL